MFRDTNPNAVSKQIQMSPTRKSRGWTSRSGSERWYQWSAGPLWWHNIDLRSSSNDDIILIRDHTMMVIQWSIMISDHTMIIDQSWYWPTFSPLHGNNSFPMRWSSPLIWQKHWHCIDDSWGPVPADLIIMTLTNHWMITITTWPIR